MKSQVAKVLSFLRLTNGDGKLSLTNIAVVVVLIKVAFASEPSIAQMATLLTVISAYNFKRWHASRSVKADLADVQQTLSEELSTLRSDIDKLKVAREFQIFDNQE